MNVGGADVACLPIPHDHSCHGDVLWRGKLEDMRESSIERARVIRGREDFIQRSVEEVEGRSSAVEVADSVIKRDVAIDARLGSGCVAAERQVGERVGVNCDRVAKNISAAGINKPCPQQYRWRGVRVITGGLEKHFVGRVTWKCRRFRRRFRQANVVLVTIEQLDARPCGADGDFVIPAAPTAGTGPERKPVVLGGTFQTAGPNLKSIPRVVKRSQRFIGIDHVESGDCSGLWRRSGVRPPMFRIEREPDECF